MIACLLLFLVAQSGPKLDPARVAKELGEMGLPVDMSKVRLLVWGRSDSPPALRRGELSEEERAIEDALSFTRGELGLSKERPSPEAWFDPSDNSIHVRGVGYPSLLGAEGILVHELVHAHQHQRYREFRARQWPSREAYLISRCVAEGQAEAAALLHLFHVRGRKPSGLEARSFAWRAGFFGWSPTVPYVVAQPYLFAQKSWAGILHRPIRQSDQLLYPDRPRKLHPSGPVFPKLPEAEFLYSAKFGELGVFQLLLERGDYAQARIAAAGWDGDLMQVYRSEKHGTFSIWVLHWDRVRDAKQFVDYARTTLPGGEYRQVGRRVTWVAAEDAGFARKIANDAMMLYAPPLRPKPVRDRTAKAEARIWAETEASFAPGEWYQFGNSGIRLRGQAGVFLSPNRRFLWFGQTYAWFMVESWPRSLFDDREDLEAFLRQQIHAKVEHSEALGPHLLLKRQLTDQLGLRHARTADLFVFTPKMILQVTASWRKNPPDKEVKMALDFLRTVEIKGS
ncbi:MAG: hypothetical protein AAGD14_01415 [Planctomycetota bacterium]